MRRVRPILAVCLSVCLLFAVFFVAAKNIPLKAERESLPAPLEEKKRFELPSDFPAEEVNQIFLAMYEEHPFERVRHYSSMGCSDLSCSDFTNHTHWCLEDCMDRSHGHSEAEYRESEKNIALYERYHTVPE